MNSSSRIAAAAPRRHDGQPGRRVRGHVAAGRRGGLTLRTRPTAPPTSTDGTEPAPPKKRPLRSRPRPRPTRMTRPRSRTAAPRSTRSNAPRRKPPQGGVSRARAVALLVGTTLAACGLDVVGVPPAGVAAGPTGEAGASRTRTSSSSSGSPTEGGPGVDASDGAPAPCVASTDLRRTPSLRRVRSPCRGATCSGGVCAPDDRDVGALRPARYRAPAPADVYVAGARGRPDPPRPEGDAGRRRNARLDTKQAPRADARGGPALLAGADEAAEREDERPRETSRPLLEGNAVIVAGEDVYFNELGLGGVIWVSPLARRRSPRHGRGLRQRRRRGGRRLRLLVGVEQRVAAACARSPTSPETWIPGEDGPESVRDRRRPHLLGGADRHSCVDAHRHARGGRPHAGPGRPRSLVHDGANLYWFDTVAKTLVRGSLSGGDATKLVPPAG